MVFNDGLGWLEHQKYQKIGKNRDFGLFLGDFGGFLTSGKSPKIPNFWPKMTQKLKIFNFGQISQAYSCEGGPSLFKKHKNIAN